MKSFNGTGGQHRRHGRRETVAEARQPLMVDDVALSCTESTHTCHSHVQGDTDNVYVIWLQMCVCVCVCVCVNECEGVARGTCNISWKKKCTKTDTTTCIFSVLEGLDTADKLTEIPKCSVAPLPVSPSTPNVRLSSRKIGTRYRLRNST